MKRNLLLILLLNGFVPVVLYLQPAAPTLYLITKVMTWPDAISYCRATYSDLVLVKTANDLQNIRNEAAHQGVTTPIWIGLYNNLVWRWSYRDVLLTSLVLQQWAPGEPNNGHGKEQCGSFAFTGYWYDYICSSQLPFICFNANYPETTRFIGIKTPMSWTDAQSYCRRVHTDLATALDSTDNTLIQNIVAIQGNSWFGLYRYGWYWVDQTTMSNISWASGEPNNYYGNENCGRFVGPLFEDVQCSYTSNFFCYYIPPIKRKILKLQVKSDQNVFDPAVQSSLLMKIVQKLQEHGLLKDITVTWRLQTDGNTFYKKK